MKFPRLRRTTESGFESCGQLLLQIWLLSFDLLELTKVDQQNVWSHQGRTKINWADAQSSPKMNKKMPLTKVEQQISWAHQGKTTNFLSSPRKNNKFLELTRNPKLDSLAKHSTASSTLQRSGLVFNICRGISHFLFFSCCSPVHLSWKPAGENEKSLAKVIYPKQLFQVQFLFDPRSWCQSTRWWCRWQPATARWRGERSRSGTPSSSTSPFSVRSGFFSIF